MTHKRVRHYFEFKICVVCAKEFRASRRDTKTCGARCRKRLQRLDPTYVEPRDRVPYTAEIASVYV